MRVRTPWIFDLGAGIYDFITAQEVWRRHCRAMAPMVCGQQAPGADAPVRILDLGIGPGVSGIAMAQAAPGALFVGLDLAAPMIERAAAEVARAGVRLPLLRADATHLPFADGTFSGATGHSFVYLVPDREAVLREAHRVLRPGARVVFLEPNGEIGPGARTRAVLRAFRESGRFGLSMFLWGIFSGLHGRFTAATLGALLERCGFAHAKVTPTLHGLGLMATAERP